MVRVECRRSLNQSDDLRSLGVRNGADRDKPLGHLLPLEQPGRVRQSDAVDEVQPHPAPFGHDQADRPFDPATDLGTVIRQAAPQQGLLGLGNAASNHVPQRLDELPGLGGQGVEERLQDWLRHPTTPDGPGNAPALLQASGAMSVLRFPFQRIA